MKKIYQNLKSVLNLPQFIATERRVKRVLTRSILKLTVRRSELKPLVTVVVIGKDKYLVKAKSVIKIRVLSAVPKKVAGV